MSKMDRENLEKFLKEKVKKFKEAPVDDQFEEEVPARARPSDSRFESSFRRPPLSKSKPSEQQKNPLLKYVRQPGTYIKLPSMGQFNEGEIEFTPTGEIPVLPMSARDELWLRNPDALLNGQAVERVIKSCCPSVHNVWRLPINDINAILLGINMASYGPILKVKAQCPHCGHENAVQLDVQQVLDVMTYLDSQYSVDLPDSGVIAYLGPQRYETAVKVAQVLFEETKIIDILRNTVDMDEKEKTKAVAVAFERISNVNVEMVAETIIAVMTPDGEVVTESQLIFEFVNGITGRDFKKLEEKIKEINQIGIPSSWTVECTNCGKEFETDIQYDPANFFDSAS